MMHQDSLKPAPIQLTLERLQESARRSGSLVEAHHSLSGPPALLS